MIKSNYSPRDAARKFHPELIERLKSEVKNGRGIAAIKAAELLLKISDLESIPQAEDDEIIVVDADPTKHPAESDIENE